MEAQSLVSHQHSWWFSCFSLREKLARSHKKTLNAATLGAFCVPLELSSSLLRVYHPFIQLSNGLFTLAIHRLSLNWQNIV